ncbi:response regulator [Collimonas pratensis]|jgi:two-component system response regulator QseB|uniref:Transcriptional regulatory, C terminal family protein n=1 Tax=Collimonas pratensis TaxID=279113 RepID=A0A127Q458_9BURK|nr:MULTISPECIES: response regulator transcription factor [Collimonas]AMP04615.1 transcriptional regulatory, C terminal family protein [Collimonas pratensis]NKI69727.1 response regulator [Collimonas pratensis]HWX01044.1 response regulator transcription factor [Collimonas sp.]
MRILLIEDDYMLGNSIRKGFYPYGFTVDWTQDGIAAEAALAAESYSAVLLDLGLPRKSGLEVLKKMRADGNSTPVIILSASDRVLNRIEGLDAGADDYLNKPFDLDELAARVRALLRRSGGRTNPQLVHGDIHFDPASNTVAYKGKQVGLSGRELMVLAALIEKPGAVLSRAQLVDKVYGWNDEVESNTIEVHIHALRKKLAPGVIRNIRGLGYMLSSSDSLCSN